MNNKKKIILTIVLLSYFVTAIDSSIVFTGLTKISADLNLNVSILSWVQNAYILAFGGFILLGGRLSDVFGRKRILNIALILFGIGSAIAGASTTAFIMISARLVQGIGAAILAPTSLALLIDTFKGEELVKVVAWYSSISGLGSSIGLILGGFLAGFTSWRDGFYINVPLTLFMLFLSITTLQYKKAEQSKFDILGIILSIAGIFSFVYAINGAANFSIWLLISVILLIGFVIVESKTSIPIMPLQLFQSKTRTCAYIARTLYMCAMLGFWFFISECLQNTFHFSPILTGVAFFPMTISMFIAAIIVPHLVNSLGNRKVLLIGVVFLLFGFILMLPINELSTYFSDIVLPLILLGFGQGFSMSPLTNLGIYNTKEEFSGAASGLVNVAHQVGGSVGLSIMVAFSKNSSAISRFHTAMIIGLIFVIVMALVSFTFSNKFQLETAN